MRKIWLLPILAVLFMTACPDPATNEDTSSTDATLSSLGFSGGTLSPAFSADQETYTASVGYSVDSLTLTAVATDADATVEYSPAMPASLSVGANTLTVTVTAEDGTTEKEYTVVVTREEAIPAVLPVIGTPSGVSRSFTPDWANFEYDIYVPAITGFSANAAATPSGGTFNSLWGGMEIEFSVTYDDEEKAFIYRAENADSYLFEVRHDQANGKFTYRHELNIDSSSIADGTDYCIGVCVIPESDLDENYHFNTTASVAAYAKGGNATAIGDFYYFEEVAVYNGELTANSRLGLSGDNLYGYGFAFHSLDFAFASTEFDMSIDNQTTMDALDDILANGLSDSISMIGTCLGVTLDGGTKFWEHNLGFDATDPPVWYKAFDDAANYVGSGNGTNGAACSLEHILTFIPWETALTVPTLSGPKLSGLVIDAGVLSPTFSSVETNYTATVDNDCENLVITATAADTGATVTYSPTMPAALAVGDNTLEVTVTSEDGTKSNTYSVVVTRE